MNMGTYQAREAVPVTESMADNNGLVLVMVCAVGGPYAQVFYVNPGLEMDGEQYNGSVPPAIGSWLPACSDMKTATAKIKQGTCALLTIGCP